MKTLRTVLCLLALTSLASCFYRPYGSPPTPETPITYSTPRKDPVEEFSDCRATVIDCNCRSTYKLPGQVVATPYCKSGMMIFESCGGYCPGSYGVSWGTQCTCQ